MSNCPKIIDASDGSIIVGQFGNLTDGEYLHGSKVQLGCKRFVFRLTGPREVTCDNGTWSENVTKSNLLCEWTGEYSTEELIVLGVTISAASLLILILMGIIIYLLVYDKKREDDEKRNNFDDPSPPPSLINTNIKKYNSQHSDRGQPRYRDGDLRELGQPRDYVDAEPPYRYTNGGAQRQTDDGYTFYSGGSNKHNYSNRAYEPGYDERPPQQGFTDSRAQQVSPEEFARYEWGGKIPRPSLEDYQSSGRRY